MLELRSGHCELFTSGFTVSREDIVFYGSLAGIVAYCLKDCVSGKLFASVNCLEKVEDHTPTSVRYRSVDGTMEAWPAESLVSVSAWYPDGSDFIVIL